MQLPQLLPPQVSTSAQVLASAQVSASAQVLASAQVSAPTVINYKSEPIPLGKNEAIFLTSPSKISSTQFTQLCLNIHT